jgi:pimeloyl-ACP methyl ester carboxylesterase
MNDTWSLPDYDLLPKLKTLSIPTLVIYGDHDFIPPRRLSTSLRQFLMPAWSR